MHEFLIKDCFDESVKKVFIDHNKYVIGDPIECITEAFYNLWRLGYGLSQLNQKIKALAKNTTWFVDFRRSIETYPDALAQLQLNTNIKKAVSKETLKVYPALKNIVDVLRCHNAVNIVRSKAKPYDVFIFNELVANGKIRIVDNGKDLTKTDLNTIPQIFHQVPINATFDNPNIVQFNELTQNQHIFICYALKKSQDVIAMNCNTNSALFVLDENFTAYQVEKELGFRHGFLGGKRFINDIVRLNFMKIAFMVGTVILPISVVNIGYDTATDKHKFQLSADFLGQKDLIKQYNQFFQIKKLTGLTIPQLFSSRQKVADIFMAMRMINEIEIRQRDGNPFDFYEEMKKYGWDVSNVDVTKRKLRRLLGMLNCKIQYYKDCGRELYALDFVSKK